MIISTRALKNAGFHVSLTPSKQPGEHYIEIHPENGSPLPDEVHKAVEDRVGIEMANVLVEELAIKISHLQVLEAVRKYENEAWRGLRRVGNGESDLDLALPRKGK